MFKLRFLPIYTMKSWFQELRRCGIEGRTRWDQEKREGRCLDSSIRLNSNSNSLNIGRTQFYRVFGRNRPIETIDGYDGTVHRGPFQTCRGRPISTNGLDDPRDGSYKNASICRRWIAIQRSRCSPPDLIVTVITPVFKPGALIAIDGPRTTWSTHGFPRRRRSDASREATSPASKTLYGT